MSTLNSTFDNDVSLTLQTETRVSSDVEKEDAVKMTVNVDLSGAEIGDVLNQDFNVRVQGAFRKSFESQQAFADWAEENGNTYNVHVSRIGHKIVSKQQQKADMKAQFAGLPEDVQKELLAEMQRNG